MNGQLKIVAAYKKLFDKEPESNAEQWRLAREIITKWDVPKIGEELALETLFEIINHTNFPDDETTRKIVGKAEYLISAFLPEMSEHDPHMSVIEFLEGEHYKKKELDKEKEFGELSKEGKIKLS